MKATGLQQVNRAPRDRSSARRVLRSRALWSAVAAIAAGYSCGDDGSAGTSSNAPSASAALSSLTGKQLTGLCQLLLPKVQAASIPTHECTWTAVQDTNDEASCGVAKQACVTNKAYDNWTKAACADFSSDAGTTPSFDCSTKVSTISDCYDSAVKWLNALTCKNADPAETSDPPSCFKDLQVGDCMFDINLLLKDTDFHAPDSNADAGTKTDAGTKDAAATEPAFYCLDGKDKYEYDLGLGDACNTCATSAQTGCCDSWVTCLSDAACECYVNCPSPDDSVCFQKCNITEVPDDFTAHANCVADSCAKECEL